jgi:urea carboxylase
VANNLEFLGRILSTKEFINGTLTTAFLNTFSFTTHAIEVQDAGLYSLIQDFPGRVGYWNVGIPPSGPMDDLNFQIANILVGNKKGDAGIEI